jgi:hypothetical protein
MKICPLFTTDNGWFDCSQERQETKVTLYNRYNIEDWIRKYCVCEFKTCEYYKRYKEALDIGLSQVTGKS